MLCGLALFTAASVACGLAELIVPMAATGFGCSLTMPAATTAIMRSAPAERGGIASGVLNSARQTGSLLGVALLGTIMAGQHISLLSLRVAMLAAAAALAAGAIVAVTGVRKPGSVRTTADKTGLAVRSALQE